MTFRHYLHFSDLIIGLKLRRSSGPLSRELIRQIAGLSKSKMTRLIKGAAAEKDLTAVSAERVVNSLQSELEKLVKDHYEPALQTPITQSLDDFCRQKSIDHKVLCLLLQRRNEGYSKERLARDFNISLIDLDRFIANSCAITEIETREANARLGFKTSEEEKSCSLFIPTEPSSRVLALQAAKNIQDLEAQIAEEGVEAFKPYLRHYLTHCLKDKSYTRFTNFDELNEFICKFEGVIPRTRWLVEISTSKTSLRKYKENSLSKVTYHFVENPGSRSESFRLYLMHPHMQEKLGAWKVTERKSANYQKYSSSELRYVFPLMVIKYFTSEDWLQVHSIDGQEVE
ncbi:hypothetical protein [Sneathiella limimaris]|uniref:hypothetical protein n=1 Tax=Sneathiella limimaris TaxID=1964213 RepID=UPI00146A6078|nr:hypothetical protein [Sneathiella limimaris]